MSRIKEFDAQRGQTLIMFVLAAGVLMGFMAMAIDVGLFYEDRRHLQNTADAAALAGVAELPVNPAAAKIKAAEWAANNGVDSSEIKTIEVRTTEFPNDTLHVEIEAEFSWIFARVLGKSKDPVGASAAARIGSISGNNDLMPWALVFGDSLCLDPLNNPIPGMNCSVKVGAGSGVTGWYGALDLDGNGGGSAEYESNIIDGTADTVYCAVGQTDPACETTDIDALSGNKVGGTGHGIAARLAAEPTPGCSKDGNDVDDFNEVFAPNSTAVAQYIVVCPDEPARHHRPHRHSQRRPDQERDHPGLGAGLPERLQVCGCHELQRGRATGRSMSPWLTPSIPRPRASSEHSIPCRPWPSAASSSSLASPSKSPAEPRSRGRRVIDVLPLVGVRSDAASRAGSADRHLVSRAPRACHKISYRARGRSPASPCHPSEYRRSGTTVTPADPTSRCSS